MMQQHHAVICDQVDLYRLRGSALPLYTRYSSVRISAISLKVFSIPVM